MKLSVPALFLAATAPQAADARLSTIRRGTDLPAPREVKSADPLDMCNPDPRPLVDLSAAFQPIQKPVDVWPDDDGVTRVQMVYDLVDYEGPSYNVILRAYNGDAPGPTLHVQPGGSMEIEFFNCLQLPIGFEGPDAHNRYHHPNSTNLHTHGPHISGEAPGDNVFVNIGPNEKETYKYEFDGNHMPGTFWYHPHLHGSTALQVGQGAAGMIIMDDPEDYDIPSAIKDMPQVPMVFQHMDLNIFRQSAAVSLDGVTNWVDHNFEITNTTTDLTNFILVNMQFLPKVTMTVNRWYRWRLAMSSVRASIAFLSQSGDCEFKLLAKDGIYLTDAPRDVEAIILSPGNRADVAVRCHEPGLEYMNTTFIDLLCVPNSPDPNFGCFEPDNQPAKEESTTVPERVGTFMDPESQPTIMVIDVVPDDSQEPDPDLETFTAPTPCYLVDLTGLDDSKIDGYFENEFFCTNPGQDKPFTGPFGWPVVVTDADICGVTGPYGVGGNTSFLTPWVDEHTYINDFPTGSVQEIELRGIPFHPYHQHINPYQIYEINARNITLPIGVQEIVANWYQVGDWHDTLQFPAALGNEGSTGGDPGMGPPIGGGFTVKMRFQVDQFTGHMVQHCHLLFHEDQGMMAQYDITGKEGDVWSGAKNIDSKCIKPTKGKKPN